MIFKDRIDAGEKLSEKLGSFKERQDTILFAVPRGGVIVAKVIADRLEIPLDIVLAKKIGAPFNKEFAIAAVDINGDVVLNNEYIEYFSMKDEYIQHQKKRVLESLKDQMIMYRGSVEYKSLKNKVAIIVDDGIATGTTTKACIRFLSKLNPKEIYVATPVIAPSTLEELQKECNGIFYIVSTEPFWAVGQFYSDFSQVSDEDIKKILG
ncbi:phosphoribosyltransferase [Caldicellulosiruptor owensensis OL]|uniref:Phosphoribosyltransferase n=1 Tax=Caldicellulosiruptor owensensis (strain ATCC 700167 / DSM 13100 / OL) TaxID=632518 RepID=E4Q3Z9_CALOW|nr:phosphoribosyltransferase family protein [Caldicellulosiruptor owensensis]ADQ04034.1 phosphoribosyltransferase [Caldicellulosiruptor owensensis OL]